MYVTYVTCGLLAIAILLLYSISEQLGAAIESLKSIENNLNRYENQRRTALFPFPDDPPSDPVGWSQRRRKAMQDAGF